MTNNSKKRKKHPVERPSRSPYHPFMLDLSGISEKDADTIEKALADAGF